MIHNGGVKQQRQIRVRVEKGIRMNFFADAYINKFKYHGLLNQGATCYLNSVLQVLFMTREFREAVERFTSENPHTEYLDRHLKDLFDDLQSHTAYTYKIINQLGIDRVYEQRDAAEYFEKILTLTSPDASRIFHGQLTHKTICSKCPTEKNTDSLVWHLPLALMDSDREEYSVVDGIEEYFRDSHFSGQDQMYCDKCDDKVDVTIKCEVKHHPEVLVLLLKRFEFDYSYMRYVKNNCSVKVPYILQIPQNQTYELCAVVDHVGDLRGGHYAASIKSQDDERWYHFNDSTVTLLDYQPFQLDNTESSRSAYLLFYRKQQTAELSTIGSVLPATSDNSIQSQDGGIKQEEEVEEAVEVGNDTAEAVSTDKHQETESSRVEPEPNVCHVEDQDSGVNVSVSDNEKIMRHDDEDSAEAEDQTEKRETLCRDTDVKVEDHNAAGVDDDKDKTSHTNVDFKPELDVSDKHPTCDPLHLQHEMTYDERRVMHETTDNERQTEDDETSEKVLAENLNREHEVSEGLYDVGQINKDQGAELKTGQDIDPKHVPMDKTELKFSTEEKSRDDEGTSESVKTRNDLHRSTEDDWKRNYEEQGEMRRETTNRKSADGRLEYLGIERREDEEIIRVQLKKEKKHVNDGRVSVKQNKSNDDKKEMSEKLSDNSRQFKRGEEKGESKRNDEDVPRRERMGSEVQSKEHIDLKVRFKSL
ncbi:probable ubiquitin carboxyl-terminal hydrolase creB isoform X3 [Anabas testudineus]|uniref:probable ubiquitin carboxyl-terminal hydrolase creB isoform X3 n=1 Tax=Anabas testudineus TaxID=64144 RepID=UPI000E45D402|nr:probable ubiquitin carboxyl-terminal hydrolase creB isoform X3 [Anabas testudineus]